MKPFYRFESKERKKRQACCVLCGSGDGSLVGRMNYIDLGTYDVVQCPQCGLASFDPVPDVETTIEGCERCSILHAVQSSRERILKGRVRAYRRGGYFARKYMRRMFKADQSFDMLEIGAGSGLFSQGIKRFFPNVNVHYTDIVKGKVEEYLKAFDCKAVAGEFSADLFSGKKFDLVIARDLIEHLRNPVQFMKDVGASLADGGYFFFITPNGRENLWECNQRLMAGAEPPLIHQNHYHYYLPETLDELLATAGLEKEVFFKWGLRRHRKGFGWKRMSRFSPVPQVDQTLFLSHKTLSEAVSYDGSALRIDGPGAILYSNIVDRFAGRVGYYDYHGHEFFVLAKGRR